MVQSIRDMIKRRPVLFGAISAVLLIAFGAAFAGFMRKTSTPRYCASCHVMLPQYEDWFYTGKHKEISCVDCHLPNDNFVNHYLWKGLDGMKDVIFFYTGLVAEPIHSTAHARKTIQENCVRCHEQTVSRITADTMRCWECHRKLWHHKINEF